ncbi:MAG: CvpA family protein [Synergistaceae bacterium]|nr:CvpA family protein [Synergistaceae bacterium]
MQVGLIIDGVLGILLMVFLYRGILRGFSGEIIGLVGFFVGLFCSWKFSDAAVVLALRYMGDFGMDRSILSLMCSLVIFFAVEIIFGIVGWILSYLVKVTKLSFTDHFMGAVIGILKTAAITLCIYGVLATFSNVIPSEWSEESYAMKGASYVWPYARDFLESHGIIDFSELTGEK